MQGFGWKNNRWDFKRWQKEFREAGSYQYAPAVPIVTLERVVDDKDYRDRWSQLGNVRRIDTFGNKVTVAFPVVDFSRLHFWEEEREAYRTRQR